MTQDESMTSADWQKTSTELVNWGAMTFSPVRDVEGACNRLCDRIDDACEGTHPEDTITISMDLDERKLMNSARRYFETAH